MSNCLVLIIQSYVNRVTVKRYTKIIIVPSMETYWLPQLVHCCHPVAESGYYTAGSSASIAHEM